MDICIIDFPGTRMVGLENRGPFSTIGEAWHRLMPIAGPAGLFRPDKRTITLCCDHAEGTPEAEFLSYVGMEFEDGIALPSELTIREIPAGPYAVGIHRGAYAGLPESWRIFENAIETATGRKATRGDCFEIYVNDPGSTPEDGLITELYVPVE